MNPINMPGRGDEATWGPCAGHPADPRTVCDEDLAEVIEAVEETVSELEGLLSQAKTGFMSADSVDAAAARCISYFVRPSNLPELMRGSVWTAKNMTPVLYALASGYAKALGREFVGRGESTALVALDRAAQAMAREARQ